MTAQRHFKLLDGLRGVAALSVVAYHFGGRLELSWMMPHGYLAVDFFFVLSGFVVAHAYGDRLRGPALSASRFIAIRLIRFLPMLLPGALIGAIIEAWRPQTASGLGHLMAVIGVSILGCLAIPLPVGTSMEQTIFPINGPVWSLFFEIVASVAFALLAKSAPIRGSAILIAITGAAGVAACAALTGAVDAGPMVVNWIGGFPRVAFAFFAGVILNMHRDRFPAAPGWLFPCLLLAVFLVPAGHGLGNAVFDLVVVLLVFPVMVGCASRSDPAGRRALALSTWSGEISYPVYAMHYPLVRGICFVVNHHAPSVPLRAAAAGIGLVGVCALSWAAYAAYDRPVRRALMAALPRSPAGGPGKLPAYWRGATLAHAPVRGGPLERRRPHRSSRNPDAFE